MHLYMYLHSPIAESRNMISQKLSRSQAHSTSRCCVMIARRPRQLLGAELALEVAVHAGVAGNGRMAEQWPSRSAFHRQAGHVTFVA
ncbi:unnamed protein product [Symbiodinium natans]|uniref:Uncharacterized protein n=1 Tax=Symbiodinium natans TaxID=878477 RepID=A0A812QYK6_9DINO|nr:unnamed protein product [Symbiodinium natans]